tara:strand:- start:789 stop:1106 length:318 start_codon:yes stop_codon:yes gene_type:complete
MAYLDHEAIRKAYSSITTIDDSFVDYGLDKDGNKISIVQSNVDAARATIDSDYAKVKYKDDRQPLYLPLEDFADAMYWNSKGDSTKLEAYYAACEKVKTDNPKPS